MVEEHADGIKTWRTLIMRNMTLKVNLEIFDNHRSNVNNAILVIVCTY